MPPIITIKKVFKNDQNLAIVLNNIYLLLKFIKKRG